MNEMQEFHHGQKSGNRTAKLTIGAIILVILAGLGAYGYRLEVASQPHYAVSDSNLPSP